MTLMEKRSKRTFYLLSDGQRYKDTRDKSLFKAVLLVLGIFVVGVTGLILYMLGVRF